MGGQKFLPFGFKKLPPERELTLHVIYVKHSFFHQSKWSRTIDLNTTQIIIFQSLRDIQQMEYLGKQLNCLQLLRDAYKLATTQPFGHLIFDLDPKTSQVLRFSSQLIDPKPFLNYSATKIFTTQPSRYRFSKETSHHQLPLPGNRIQSKKVTLQWMIQVR